MGVGSRSGRPSIAVGLVIGVVIALSASAAAQPKDLSAGGSLHVDLRYASTPDTTDDEVDHLVTAGAAFRGLVRRGYLAYALGFDYHFGGNTGGGFAYEVNVYPLGIGTNLGSFGLVGALIGAGFSGIAPSRAPFAGQFPAELFVELDVGGWFRLATWGRSAWVVGADPRADGADAALFGDELEIGATLRMGKRLREWKFSEGAGYYVGATFAQRMNTDFYGVVFGYSINALYRG